MDANSEPVPLGRLRTTLEVLAILLILGAAYLANRREIGVGDTEATKMTCVAILKGDGLDLRRFDLILNFLRGEEEIPYFVERQGDRLISRYPIGTAAIALPLIGPQLQWLDRYRPGWDSKPLKEWYYSTLMAKNAATAIGIALGLTSYFLLRQLGLARVAFVATLIAGLGSNQWMIGSQSLWQQGPAAFLLALALLLLAPRGDSRVRLVAAGLATGMLVWIRLPDAIFAVALVLWALAVLRLRALWMLLPFFAMVLGLCAWNLAIFGNLMGGTAALESAEMHRLMHGIDSAWSADLIDGLLGTLVSPSRGLFLFTPWVPLTLLLIPRSYRYLNKPSLPMALTAALLPFLLMLAAYSVWWGGHSFGPRYWTDAAPVFTIWLGASLAFATRPPRVLLLGLLSLAIAFSVGVQVIGAVYYPSTWFTKPEMVDRNKQRLWDWTDSELIRCLREKPHPPFQINFDE